MIFDLFSQAKEVTGNLIMSFKDWEHLRVIFVELY